MLGEAEQRRLVEIEALLRADDPAFVKQFDARQNVTGTGRILSFAGILLAVTVTAVTLIAGNLAVAIPGLFGMVAATGIWLYLLCRGGAPTRQRRRLR
jgi:hypothetical protein